MAEFCAKLVQATKGTSIETLEALLQQRNSLPSPELLESEATQARAKLTVLKVHPCACFAASACCF